jgi:(S)-2-hydroxy-acid oxidase
LQLYIPIFRANQSEKGQNKSGSGINDYVSSLFDRSLTWQDITWLKRLTSLPIIVKGILHPDDARIAIQYGVNGIMVSNHGARQLDGVEATIDALKAIIDVVQTLDPRVEVYLDGGIRQGTDVLKALALGAKLVTIGRPVLWGLTLDGENGVTLTLNLLRKELELAMALSGCTDVQKVDKDLVKVAGNSKL